MVTQSREAKDWADQQAQQQPGPEAWRRFRAAAQLAEASERRASPGTWRATGVDRIAHAGTWPLRWARRLRHRMSWSLDHARLRWYRDDTTTYRLTARSVVPGGLRLFARITVEGLEQIPVTGPVILAANHRDNLDGYLLLHLIPRTIHIAARPDAFGTGILCGFWRRLGVFPGDAWGLRYALTLLQEGRVVALFPQATISPELDIGRSAVGLLAVRSCAPVVPIAITGTEKVRFLRPVLKRAHIVVRCGLPVTFAGTQPGALGRLAVTDRIRRDIGALLATPGISPQSPSARGLPDHEQASATH